jgi:hypothetical protein
MTQASAHTPATPYNESFCRGFDLEFVVAGADASASSAVVRVTTEDHGSPDMVRDIIFSAVTEWFYDTPAGRKFASHRPGVTIEDLALLLASHDSELNDRLRNRGIRHLAIKLICGNLVDWELDDNLVGGVQ